MAENSRSKEFSIAREELNDAVAVVCVVLRATAVEEHTKHSATRILQRAAMKVDLVLTGALSRAAIEDSEVK